MLKEQAPCVRAGRFRKIEIGRQDVILEQRGARSATPSGPREGFA